MSIGWDGWLYHGYSYRSSLISVFGRDRNGRGTFCHCGYETGLTYLGDSFIIAGPGYILVGSILGLHNSDELHCLSDFQFLVTLGDAYVGDGYWLRRFGKLNLNLAYQFGVQP